uniref:Glycosyltransferase family 92 protein n=1 Tax=Caenorhabditis tropicalis TaxID=1561998 RepID=A0A1I7TDT9_9PELO
MNEYDRKVIDNYERLGIAESTKYVTEYLRLGWMFHLLQTHECHYRSKFHSKWVANMDIDERLIYTGPFNLKYYLRSMPSNIGEVSFTTNRVVKTDPIPEKYTNEKQLLSELMFTKYNQTTEINWYNLKGIIRPEKVASLFYHWSYFQFKGVKVMSVPKRFGHVRHYRNMNKSALNGNWMENYNGTLRETRLSPLFEKKLMNAVRRRVKYVYDQRMVRCEEIPEWLTSRFKRELLDY